MIEYCDWCKRRNVKTDLFIMGADWDIFKSVCDNCHLEMVKLRKSICNKVPSFDDERYSSMIHYLGGEEERLKHEAKIKLNDENRIKEYNALR